MTLLIALIANGIHAHLTGELFIGTGWIVAIWILHLLSHGSKK